MPEHRRSRKPRNRKSETGRSEAKKPEVEPERGGSQRKTANTGVTLQAKGGKGFEDIFQKGPSRQATLKNGSQVEMAFAYEAWETLNRLLTNRPELITAAMARLRGEKVSPVMRRELRDLYLTDRAGELIPHIRDVLLSGYQEDGPVIVNPFKLDSLADRQAFEQLQAHQKNNRLRFMRYFGLPPDDPPG